MSVPHTTTGSITVDGQYFDAEGDESRRREWWRWHFAGQALNGLASSGRYDRSDDLVASVVPDAITVADALIAALEGKR